MRSHYCGEITAKNLDKENALYFAEKAKKIQPSNPLTINAYALALLINGKINKCIEILENLIQNYESADAFSNLGAAYRDSGNLKKSYANYLKANQLKPYDGQIFRNLSNSKFYNPGAKELKIHEKYYEALTNETQKAMYGFGLHNVYEKLNDYEKSFFYLNKSILQGRHLQ